MIRACVIYNYNSYYRLILSDNLKLRSLYKTLPFLVHRKPNDVLYIICNGQIIGTDPTILDNTLNMFGLSEGRCTIHIIFKIPDDAYTYNQTDLLASYNAANYPVRMTGSSLERDPGMSLSQRANLLMETLLEPMVIVASEQRISEILVDIDESEAATTCVICNESGGSYVRINTCGHVFHRECISDWLTTFSTRCPVCDSDVR
jgi:hypothetical protein